MIYLLLNYFCLKTSSTIFLHYTFNWYLIVIFYSEITFFTIFLLTIIYYLYIFLHLPQKIMFLMAYVSLPQCIPPRYNRMQLFLIKYKTTNIGTNCRQRHLQCVQNKLIYQSRKCNWCV